MIRAFACLLFVTPIALAGCGAGPEASSGDEGESAAPPVGFALPHRACSADGARCVDTDVPLLDQFDPLVLEYDWHVFPREPFANAAEKGRAIAAHGGYDTAIAMVQAAALARRDATEALEGSRTREVLAASLVQPVWVKPGFKAFRRAQVRQLFGPKSSYDGGGRERSFATRGDAYHLPELLADLGALARREPAGCDPRRFRSCAHVEGAAGEYHREEGADARRITSDDVAARVARSFLHVIAFEGPAGGAHGVAIAGVDLRDGAFPLVAYDPAHAAVRAARIEAGDDARAARIRFADDVRAAYPVTLVERLRVTARTPR